MTNKKKHKVIKKAKAIKKVKAEKPIIMAEEFPHLPLKLERKHLLAIQGIIYNVDELKNKPRRLYRALRDFMDAFMEPDKKNDEEIKYFNENIDMIDYAEEMYYKIYTLFNIPSTIMRIAKEVEKEMYSSQEYQTQLRSQKRFRKDFKQEDFDTRWHGDKYTTQKTLQALLPKLINEITEDII